MKFPIALITLLCLSSINSALVSKKFCPKFDHDFVAGFVKYIVSPIPYWRVDGSFRENLLNVTDEFIDALPPIQWIESLDTKGNLVLWTEIMLRNNPIVAFNRHETLEYNVGKLVEFINDHSLFALNKTKVLNSILQTASEYGFEGLDAEKSSENVEIFVETGLKNIKVEEIHSFKDWVNAVIVHETENFLGFGPDHTIQEIIAGFLDMMYIACESGH